MKPDQTCDSGLTPIHGAGVCAFRNSSKFCLVASRMVLNCIKLFFLHRTYAEQLGTNVVKELVQLLHEQMGALLSLASAESQWSTPSTTPTSVEDTDSKEIVRRDSKTGEIIKGRY